MFGFRILNSLSRVVLKVQSAGGDPAKLSDLGTIIDSGLHIAYIVAIPLAILFAFIGAYMWIIARDDSEKLKKAKMTITWAIIGLVFTLLIGVSMKFIVATILQNTLPNVDKESSKIKRSYI